MLAQAVIFNNLVLFNCALPFVFIYFILTLPVTFSTNLSLTLGFITGLCVDCFTDTYGMNTVSCTVLAFIRKPIFHLYVPHDDDLAGQRLSMRTMGPASFLKYSVTMVLIYAILLNTIDAFSLFNPLRLLVRIIAGTLYTFIIIYAIDSLALNNNEKKL